MPRIPVFDWLKADRDSIAEICRRHHVARFNVFGSATTESFDPDQSDVDFLIEFASEETVDLFDAYFGVKEELEGLFGLRVDLVMQPALRNPYFAEEVNRTRQEIYAA